MFSVSNVQIAHYAYTVYTIEIFIIYFNREMLLHDCIITRETTVKFLM
jgi:hypothetical protein